MVVDKIEVESLIVISEDQVTMRRNYRVHDCRINIFRDSSKELYSDQLFNAEQIGKDIDPDVTEHIFDYKPKVIPWRMQGTALPTLLER